jgi:bacteriorhodopsin
VEKSRRMKLLWRVTLVVVIVFASLLLVWHNLEGPTKQAFIDEGKIFLFILFMLFLGLLGYAIFFVFVGIPIIIANNQQIIRERLKRFWNWLMAKPVS